MPLSRDEIKRLRGEAHSLAPVVRVGGGGLTDAVVRAMDDSLEAHELVKIRMLTDDRDQRAAWIEEVLKRTRSEKIHAIGKTLTMWRKRQPKKAKEGRAH